MGFASSNRKGSWIKGVKGLKFVRSRSLSVPFSTPHGGNPARKRAARQSEQGGSFDAADLEGMRAEMVASVRQQVMKKLGLSEDHPDVSAAVEKLIGGSST